MSQPSLFLNAPPLLRLDAVDEKDVISRTAGLLAGCPDLLDGAGFLAAVLERQKIHPPLLGNGVALPHARTPLVSEMVCVAARCVTPVPFGAEALPVRLVFLFGVPPHRISDYLAVTAALVRRLRDPAVVEGLLNAESGVEFQQWLER